MGAGAFDMHFENPFAQTGEWYKGCLHVHSAASDGAQTPDEVLAWYQTRGYHFVALTDHNVPSEARTLADGFITLAGVEIDGYDPVSGLYHLVGLGLEIPWSGRQAGSLQQAVERLRAMGTLVYLAHPYWSGQLSAHLVGVKGYFALEVYNGGCEVDDAKGFSNVHWDDLLAAGCRLWGLAVDDAHWRSGDRDAGLGWVWVKAPSLTQQSILDALEKGCFYASTGPQIHDLRFDAERREITVRCSPVAAIDFIGRGPNSRRVLPRTGQILAEASYRVRESQRYARVACQDGQGRWAWSNPVFLEGGV